jgi:hypothetical protein
VAENQDTPATSGPDPRGSVNALGLHLRRAFQERRWREVADLFAFDRLWAFDAPLAKDAACDWADKRFAKVRDLEVSLVRVLRTLASEDEPSGSYTCCLLWIDEDTWEQHEVEFDLHLGFGRDADGRWQVAHLGLTPPTPEDMPELDEGPAQGFVPAAVPGAHDGLSLFAGAERPAGNGQVVVYVPVSMAPAAARALLDRERPKSRP